MAPKVSTNSPSSGRRRRGSVTETSKQATANSKLARVFMKIKPVSNLLKDTPKDAAHTPDLPPSRRSLIENENEVESPVMDISPAFPHIYPLEPTVEPRGLGIQFFNPPSVIGHPDSIPENNVSEWITFCSQIPMDHVTEVSRQSESMLETRYTRDGTCTQLGGATSSMTLMDSDIHPAENCEAYPVYIQDTPYIERSKPSPQLGDDVVLQYILGGMGSQEAIEASSIKESVHEPLLNASSDKFFPEIRHRKDPTFQDVPQIAVTAPTPKPGLGIYWSPVPPIPSSPPVYLRSKNKRVDCHLYRVNSHPDIFPNAHLPPGRILAAGDDGSRLFESDLSTLPASSALIASRIAARTARVGGFSSNGDDHGRKAPSTFGVFIRRFSTGLTSFFRPVRSNKSTKSPGAEAHRPGKPSAPPTLPVSITQPMVSLYSRHNSFVTLPSVSKDH